MATPGKKEVIRDGSGAYILERVFEDIHEYEIYFEFANKDSADKLTPNRLRISFKLNGRKMELLYPDNERVVEIIIPITKAQNNPRSKDKLKRRYIEEYADLVPKIRLSLKNQIAANNKVLGPAQKIKRELDLATKKRRTAAVRKAKKMAKDNS